MKAIIVVVTEAVKNRKVQQELEQREAGEQHGSRGGLGHGHPVAESSVFWDKLWRSCLSLT